jgi:hypothetical protein
MKLNEFMGRICGLLTFFVQKIAKRANNNFQLTGYFIGIDPELSSINAILR